MKRFVILCLCLSWLIFLNGCSSANTKQLSELQPEIIIQHATGEILADSDTPISGEYGYFIDKETGRKFRYVNGFTYQYLYRDLGLKIETSRGYADYSYKKYTGYLLKRFGNIIYNAQGKIWEDYIEAYTKDPDVSLEQIVTKEHLSKGCVTSTGIFDKKTAYFDSMIGFDVVYINSIDLTKNCPTDKQFPQHEMPIIFIMNSKHPEHYYKLGIQDGCAPGPCSIFGDIEFF